MDLGKCVVGKEYEVEEVGLIFLDLSKLIVCNVINMNGDEKLDCILSNVYLVVD